MINLKELYEKIGDIRLIAVSKNVTSKEVIELINQGQIEFGENRVQEMAKKQTELANFNPKWHMIGRLQDNKINQLISLRPTLWQSCDSFKKAVAVDKRLDYKLDTLLQINSANEDSKQGVSTNQAIEEYIKIKQECKNINLIGVMSIGANVEDEKQIQKSFEQTYKIYESLRSDGANICSMGMSSDFMLAIKCGSNMIRLGTVLYK
ncbi:YggS family pyridoxal phosphate enzyme [Campylobacter pinnipediorum subsp. pinnipediorum]|uniref:Pyridoxal phosphate homeostasis protein n=1 Tax=Campylobacter pinnipediorum subsp. pinnipediorum TaxID=1660067 RepID=A0AAX0LCI8_9BACT|nr:YggS family pyridoxal phosphate-dependent enzyme [Campylobacter pinnipediorum]OPA79628.1 YggS family pyridoxal phosphate enzyme [Campylobacter pinnipediorum subsp. pinnipediorum]OPA81769.1 YggS family pyridoxal phosphate enzyme [Campylobacter pinnipediorum subsp. pinnipediorum]